MKYRAALTLIVVLLLLACCAGTVSAQSRRCSIIGKLSDRTATIALIAPQGNVRKGTVSPDGKFKIAQLRSGDLTGSYLHVFGADGSYRGPVVLLKGSGRSLMAFSGQTARTIDLGNVLLKGGAAFPSRRVARNLVDTRIITDARSDGTPVGANRFGYNTGRIRRNQKGGGPGEDLDGDGIVNAFDIDDDGDGNFDFVDANASGARSAAGSGSAAHDPVVSLTLDMFDTRNVAIDPELSLKKIDDVIRLPGAFSMALGFPIDPADPAPPDGGHLVCPRGLEYCWKAADGGSSSVYVGVRGSSRDLVGQRFSDIGTNGSGFPNLELLGVPALVAAIDPQLRFGGFALGQAFTVVFTSAGSTLGSRPLSIQPFMVTVPALYRWESNLIALPDYGDPRTLGMGAGNPIPVRSEGIELIFNRPQRLFIPGIEPESEFGPFRDVGLLRYGVVIEGLERDVTCGGLYTSLSSTLTERPSAGQDGSFDAARGAELYPLVDSRKDSAPDPDERPKFRVNLEGCLRRVEGASPGVYPVLLVAAGERMSGGWNRAAQRIYMRIP